MIRDDDRLRNSIQTIEDWIINGRIGKITFIVAQSWDDENNLPVVDYSVEDDDGDEIVGDLNFDTLEQALRDISKSLEEKRIKNDK